MFHAVIRWGLGLHGTFHLIEFGINIYEGAYISALFTLIASLLMLGGAFIDNQNHKENNMSTPDKLTSYRNNRIMWEPCAVAFDFNPSTHVNEKPGDLFFEPGFYMFNDHTILNWKTLTPTFDFVYLIKAEGDRCKEDGTPIQPELYRKCDKGVVVRKLSLLNKDGNQRRSCSFMGAYNVFVVAAPDGVTINGEEFHFQLPRKILEEK